MIRIAVFSDIHGNLEALKAIYRDIVEEGIHKIYNLGDMIAIGPEPKETMDFILSKKIVSLRGNHEDYYLSITKEGTVDIPQQELNHQLWVASTLGKSYYDYFYQLPYEINLLCEGVQIYMCHYPFKKENNQFKNFMNLETEINRSCFKDIEADLYLFGHQHSGRQSIEDEDMTLINLRSSGVTSTNTTYYTIVTIDENTYKIDHKEVIYDRRAVIEKFDTNKVPEREFIKKFFYKIE